MSQYILGIRPCLDGLQIDPCLPENMDGFRCTRKFRGNTYNINVTNPEHVEKGVTIIKVDGKEIEGNIIPADACACSAAGESAGVHTVEVVMG